VGFPTREPMLAEGNVAAITGFSFSSVVNLKRLGVPADDISNILMADHGLELYGNAILVNTDWAAENGETVEAFLRAVAKGWMDVVADPAGGIESLLVPTIFFLGLAAGVFNVGALSLMMDMTIEGATGLYMGLWGVAQAIGMGLSSVMAGALHSSLIASGFLSQGFGYLLIFGAEAGMLLVAIWLLRRVNVQAFQDHAGGSNTQAVRPRPRFVSALGNANG